MQQRFRIDSFHRNDRRHVEKFVSEEFFGQTEQVTGGIWLVTVVTVTVTGPNFR